MAATQVGGIELTANVYKDSGLTETEDVVLQNTTGHTLKLVVADTQPDADFVGPHAIEPGGVWMRADTANTPILQGKIWLLSLYTGIIPVTK